MQKKGSKKICEKVACVGAEGTGERGGEHEE